MKKILLIICFLSMSLFANDNDDESLSKYLNRVLTEQISELAQEEDHTKVFIVNDENIQFYIKGMIDAYYECLIHVNHLYDYNNYN
jgi:hypothetical protein